MLTTEQISRFHRDGFVRGGPVLDEQRVEILRDEIARVIRDQHDASKPQPVRVINMGGPTGEVWQIVNIWQASEPFRKLISHPIIVQEVAQLANASELRIWHDQIQYKPSAAGGVNMWHQDAPYWPILRPLDAMVTAWVALDDVDESNGCMNMVPGSHHWGNQIDFLHTLKYFDAMPSSFEGHSIEVRTCPVPLGSVHYHHALTWHGSGPNRSGQPRRAVALHYLTDRTRYVAAGDHVMKPFVAVADGEVLRGEWFPQVWKSSKV